MISAWLKETQVSKRLHKLYLKNKKQKQVNASLQPLSIIYGYNSPKLISEYPE